MTIFDLARIARDSGAAHLPAEQQQGRPMEFVWPVVAIVIVLAWVLA